MGINVNLKATGLSTYSNNLDLNPGALLIADNVVIDRPNVVEQRRGFTDYGTDLPSTADRSKQLLVYKGRILRHYDDVIQFDSNASGAFTSFNGSYNETESGLRIKSLEANGNFYFTSSEGIKKISASAASDFTSAAGFITQAGAPKALDLALSLTPTGTGFLPYNSKVSYRTVWGKRDSNNNLILGTPSPRTEIAYNLTETFVEDFNNLLISLDSASGQLLQDNDYFTANRLTNISNVQEMWEAVTAVSQKLDYDLTLAGATAAISSHITTSTQFTLKFNNPISSFISAGDEIELSGLSNTSLNSTTATPSWTVLSVDTITGTSATFSATGGLTPAAVVAESAATSRSYNFRALSEKAPTAFAELPTYAEYTGMLDQFNAIVNILSEISTINHSGWIDVSYIPLATNAVDQVEVKLNFTIPSEITTTTTNDYFYQIYRTDIITANAAGITLSDIDSGDEMRLVYEGNATTAEVTAGYVEFSDSTPDELLGGFLYTNPNSGEGILQANDRPPIAKDVALFKNCVFYANTQTLHQKTINLIGIDLLQTAVTSISPTATTLAASTITVEFNGAASSVVTAGNTLSFTGFTNTSDYLNGVFQVASVSGVSANLTYNTSYTAATDTTTANFGDITRCESINFIRGSTTGTYTFIPENLEKNKIVFNAAGTLTSSGTADYFKIYSPSESFYVWYKIGTATDPAPSGFTGIEIALAGSETADQVAASTIVKLQEKEDFNSLGGTIYTSATGYVECTQSGITSDITDVGTGFTFQVVRQGSGENITNKQVLLATAGSPAQNIEDTAKSLIKVLNRNNSSLDLSGFYISNTTDLPGKILLQSSTLDDTSFYITVNTTEVGFAFDPTIPVSGATVISSNDSAPNYVFFSKQQQPEHVPIVNYFPVGPKDKKIKRILALRDSLFILKEDGIYRVSGDGPSNFSVFLFDTSARILAADSSVVLNNQIYMWSDQGVVRVSDTGVDILSRDIEDLINKLVYTNNYSTVSFGVSYDLDRAYLLWLPSNTNDTYATQCFRYNIFTAAWTRWPIAKTCGIVGADTKLYLGSAIENIIEKERKSLSRADHCDKEFTTTVDNNSVSDTRIVLTSVSNVKQHDVIAQEQYITIVDFNRLLKKLDTDPSSQLSNNYYASVSGAAGYNIKNGIDTLVTKLDTDLSTTAFSNLASVTDASNSAPSSLQTAFNDITTLLNSSTGVTFDNYFSVTGTTFYESLIDSVSNNEAAVITKLPLPIIVGPVTIYKHFTSKVEYAPNHFGNPVALKHVREATYLFKSDNFHGAEFSYATDLSPGFEMIEVENLENGTFGNYNYGEGYYGGGGQSVPLRVLIPRQKQRCTFMRCQFQHHNAREIFQLYGVSLTLEINAVEARAYR